MRNSITVSLTRAIRAFSIVLVALLALNFFTFSQVPTIQTLKGINAVPGSSVVFAVGGGGTMARSTDDGSTWSLISSGTSYALNDVVFPNASTGYAIGYTAAVPYSGNGGVFRSTDGGLTWSQQLVVTGSLFATWFTSPSTGYAIGYGGLDPKIHMTTNGASTWSYATSPTYYNFFGIYFADENNGWAVGGITGTGLVIRTTNGGSSWTLQTTIGRQLSGVSFANANVGAAVGEAGTVLWTTDGGATWASKSSGTTQWLNKIALLDANTAVAVGGGGTILRTINGGTNWTSIASGTTETFFGLSFRNSLTGFVSSTAGMVKRTNDGGLSWSTPGGGGGTVDPPATPTLASPANDSGNQPTSLTLTWNSSNGASSYQVQVSTSSAFTNYVLDDANVAGTSRTVSGLSTSTSYFWRVRASNTGGTSGWSNTWSFTTLAAPAVPMFAASPRSISFGDNTVGTSRKDSVVVTNSGGATLVISSITSSNQRFSVSPTSASVAAGASQKIYVTFTPTNKAAQSANILFNHNASGGRDTVKVTGKGANAPKVATNKTSITFRPSTGGSVDSFLVINEGSSFLVIENVYSTNSLFSAVLEATVVPPLESRTVYVYAGGSTSLQSGYIVLEHTGEGATSSVYVETSNPTAVGDDWAGTPREYRLQQNYPNPFNPSTSIVYALPEASIVRLSVYNILGQEIATLIDGQVAAGMHTVEWNTTTGGRIVPSGVYFSRMSAVSTVTGKEFVQTNRMMLAK
jgi:photosystem II stability/assembly factor-like uncharacterized protein